MSEGYLPGPRAVLFDWDNTLVENWRTVQAALNTVLEAAGRAPLDLCQVKHQARHSPRTIFPTLFGERWQDARATFLTHFRAHHLSGLRIMPGAEMLIEALREMGVPLAVVSNKEGDLLRREIAHLGWAGHFGSVVGANDAPADKPDPAPIHVALERMSLTAGPDIWFVGDTDVDMRAARAARCSAILVGAWPIDTKLMEGVEPALSYQDCSELAGFVGRGRLPICHVSPG